MSDLAERKLAALILLETDVDIASGDLGAFIREHWDRVAPLAHLIHGRDKGVPDTSKATTRANADWTAYEVRISNKDITE